MKYLFSLTTKLMDDQMCKMPAGISEDLFYTKIQGSSLYVLSAVYL